jgi:peptidyl-prolyl cis-trans isomerase A (cyclophilin A)
MLIRRLLLLLVFTLGLPTTALPDVTEKPMVQIETTMGNIVLELFAKEAPLTVNNFLAYVDSGFYNGTIFHRVIQDFMIQGGGFNEKMEEKPTQEPIKNESDNGRSNRRGTIAMARTSNPDSATAQFYINLKSNPFLDYNARTRTAGYAVFGRVIQGMDVVDVIAEQPVGNYGPHQNVPGIPIKILAIKRL